MRIVFVYPANARAVDGIRDYATRAVEQLKYEGDDAELVRPPRGLRMGPRILAALPRGGEAALLVQYNPFAWGRRGFAPTLVLALVLVRLTRPGVRVVLVVHEAYVPMRDVGTSLMGAWQRAQLRILIILTHAVIAATGSLTAKLSQGWPRRPVTHVPVGSNLPDERRSRSMARAEAGLDGALVIATLTTGHETHLHALVLHAADAVARACPEPVVLLLLGENNVPPSGVESVARTMAPGYLDDKALSRALSTSDLFLAPFLEGATTRRTSLMAAMQHGVAIVTTASKNTEAVLKDGEALAVASPDDADEFARQAVRMAEDPGLRKRHAFAGRELYDRHFSWVSVCASLRAAIAARF